MMRATLSGVASLGASPQMGAMAAKRRGEARASSHAPSPPMLHPVRYTRSGSIRNSAAAWVQG